MKKISKDKKDTLILLGIGTAFFCAFAIQFFVAGQRQKINSHKSQLGKIERDNSKLQRLLSKKESIISDYTAALSQIETLEEYMADGDPYTWALLKMEEFNRDYANVRARIQAGKVDQKPLLPGFNFQVIRFGVIGEAPFHELGAYVSDLENSNPFYRIENLSIEQKNGVPAIIRGRSYNESLSFNFDLVVIIKRKSGS